MLKKLLLGIAAAVALVVVLLAVVVAVQPSEFHIARSAKMKAPPAAVFTQVNDFHKWDEWSPWVKLDPQAKTSFEGPAAGEGAIFRWAGNADVGEGSMTIMESRPHDLVRIKLHFVKPFEDTAITEFILRPGGEETNVTWSMDGKNNFIAKALCLFVMDMDKMIGDKYDEGLARIKKIVEAPPEDQPDETVKKEG